MTDKTALPPEAIHAVQFDMVLRAEYEAATDDTPEVARWQAITSTTKQDRVGEHTTPMLYHDWVKRIEKGIQVPFLPSPEMPYLSVSHYADFEGLGVAGTTDRLSHRPADDATTYVFEAAGAFNMKNPLNLGRDLLDAAMKEQSLVARGEDIEEPMRVSAAWFDLVHRHGDQVFIRQSLNERCPLCEAGVGDKYYMQGQLVHFAVTRVPINPDTPFGLEEKSMPITKQSDAESLVSPEAAKKLDELERSQMTTAKSSAALTVKSEGDEEAQPEAQPTPTLGTTIRSMRMQASLGPQTVARSLSVSPTVLDDIERDKLVPALPILRSLARLYDVQPLELVRLLPEGTKIPETVERMMGHYDQMMEAAEEFNPNPYQRALDMSRPFGAAMTPRSFEEAERYEEEGEILQSLAGCLYTGQKIILNILEDPALVDKAAAVLGALRDEVTRAERIIDKERAEEAEMGVMMQSEAALVEQAKAKKKPKVAADVPDFIKEKIMGDEEDDGEEDKAKAKKSEAVEPEPEPEPDPEVERAAAKKSKKMPPSIFDEEEEEAPTDDMPSKSQTQGVEAMPSKLSKLEELAAQVGRALTETADDETLDIEAKYRAAEEVIGDYAAEVQRAFLAKSGAAPQGVNGSEIGQAIAEALAPMLQQLSQVTQSVVETGQQLALQTEKSQFGVFGVTPQLQQQHVAFDPNSGLPVVGTRQNPEVMPTRKSVAAAIAPQQQVVQQAGIPRPNAQPYGHLAGPNANNPTPGLRGLIRRQYNLQQQ